ncbi:CamS family sex pheromone protein [Virgibacillus salarius]|uniref:CamS family sex pheromone protein n=1 Tax=Virgibacillus salarius TaxID=447199 RepID=UPI0031EE425D
MKKLSIWLLGVLLFVTSCAPDVNEEEVVQNDESDSKQETAIVPSYQLSEENYKMILPFEPGKARGVIVGQVANRLDIDEMEEGLRRQSKEVYDPKKYLFQEGQYIDEDTVLKWIDKLNPPKKEKAKKKYFEDNPRYLSHILEQNYLVKKEDKSVELAGISLGIAMKSVYRFQTEPGGPYYYESISESEMLKEGNKIAQKVIKSIREIEGLEKVPVMMALYREEDQSSPVPEILLQRLMFLVIVHPLVIGIRLMKNMFYSLPTRGRKNIMRIKRSLLALEKKLLHIFQTM